MSETVADPETDGTGSLARKLLEIAETVSGVEKGGRNATQGYDYVQATDVLRAIRKELFARKLFVTKAVVPGSLQHFSETGGKSFVTSIETVYTIHDLESGESIEFEWVEAGADIGGEKGLYKAFTGGLKYFLLQQFLIPSGEDPETDSTSETADSAPEERAAAPVIPVDRARTILTKAVEAGLATATENQAPELKAVLVAKLADVGVDTGKLGHLNVDQAEAVEAWIAAEANKSA